MIDIIAVVLLAFGSLTILFAPRALSEKLGGVALLALLVGAFLTAVGLL